MKDQTKKTHTQRVSTVYPLTKRSASYTSRPTLSPKSMSQSHIAKRRIPPPPLSSASSSYTSSSQASSSPDYPGTSRLAHQRALAAQRSAALAQRAALRNVHVNSLDRAIKGLLEEEFRDDVKAVMLEKEKLTMASASAMDQQPELQWHMRGHLLDFLLEIHLHFRLRPETLYLTLSILDRYVSRRIVYKKHYQLVGCVSLWLAAKFEDAKERVPSVKDLKELCHNAYEEGAFVQMEGHVLGTIDWEMGTPTAESWLRVLCTETSTDLNGEPFEDTRTQHVARFLMECSLYGRDYIQFPPSVLALGALCLARQICGKPRRPADESAPVLQMISMLDHTLSQNLDSVSQTLVKKYSFAYYSKASAVVVSFYLRGGRYPTRATPGVDTPECLTTNVVPIETLRASYRSRVVMPPQTPVRERMEMSWGSGRTDVESTPGLVRSDSSSSSVMGMDMEDDVEFAVDEEEVEVDAFDNSGFEIYRSRSGSGSTNSTGILFHSKSSSTSSNENVLLFHPHAKDQGMLTADSVESMPITPTTPMFELNPFGPAQPPPHKSDKENFVPNPLHALPPPVHPCVGDLEDSEYRQALLAIVP